MSVMYIYIMSRVKVLMRNSKLDPRPFVQMVPNIEPRNSMLDSLTDRFKSMFATRKSASGGPLTIAERIGEFIARNKPNIDIDMPSLVTTLANLKVPALAILGIAFVSGLAYLAYKLYNNWSASKAEETVNKIMKDFEETTPDLLDIPGWYDQVRNEVVAAVNTGNEKDMVERVAAIKNSIMEKQQSMGGRVGGGIDLIDSYANGRGIVPMEIYQPIAHGAGVVMPV